MHNNILKFFKFLKNVIHFLKIATMFCILFLILYWIQNLTNDKWDWLLFIQPLLKFFVEIGNQISTGSIQLFGAIFEYKYMIAVCIFGAIYYGCNLLDKFVEFFEEMYDEARVLVKRKQQDSINKELQNSLTKEQSGIKNFQVYVETFPKKDTLGYNLINMEEQNQIMNKFLSEKTGVLPIKYGNGFLYSYENFNKVDWVLKFFFRLIHSEAPINYVISVRIIKGDEYSDKELFNKLIELKLLNKISMLAEVAYRYTYNPLRSYDTTQIGIYKMESKDFEVHEFIEK